MGKRTSDDRTWKGFSHDCGITDLDRPFWGVSQTLRECRRARSRVRLVERGLDVGGFPRALASGVEEDEAESVGAPRLELRDLRVVLFLLERPIGAQTDQFGQFDRVRRHIAGDREETELAQPKRGAQRRAREAFLGATIAPLADHVVAERLGRVESRCGVSGGKSGRAGCLEMPSAHARDAVLPLS